MDALQMLLTAGVFALPLLALGCEQKDAKPLSVSRQVAAEKPAVVVAEQKTYGKSWQRTSVSKAFGDVGKWLRKGTSVDEAWRHLSPRTPAVYGDPGTGKWEYTYHDDMTGETLIISCQYDKTNVCRVTEWSTYVPRVTEKSRL